MKFEIDETLEDDLLSILDERCPNADVHTITVGEDINGNILFEIRFWQGGENGRMFVEVDGGELIASTLERNL